MNWWIFLQISQWLLPVTPAPGPYSLSDEAFFDQPTCHQLIKLTSPDTVLLDAALFQATNQARRLAGLAKLRYDPGLYKAACNHAESMIRYDYISHENGYVANEMTLLKRVQNQTDRFALLAENIGQYQTIATAQQYGARLNKQQQQYDYIDLETMQPYQPFTYATYAQYAVQQWLNSPHHRRNLLNPFFTHVGCAGRLSVQPFAQRSAPFGRLVQNFGTQRLSEQVSR